MKSNLVSLLWGMVAMGGVSCGLGCSDQVGPPIVQRSAGGDSNTAGVASAGSPAQAAGQGGAAAGGESEAGAGGAAPTQCSTDAECNDGLRCNGVETCFDGACRAGTPSACSNAATCVEDTRWALCAYPDASPWFVYIADEDTPGTEELYAVKESLIGVQAPIKVNAPLTATAGYTPRIVSQLWTDDGNWLAYEVVADSRGSVIRYYAVRFASGMPEPPIELTQGLPDGQYSVSYSFLGRDISPNGSDILLYQPNGDLYRIDLNASVAPTPLKLNLSFEAVQTASWVQGGRAIAYTTSNQAFLLHADGVMHRDAFNGFVAGQQMLPSADGNQLIFTDSETYDFYVAKAAPLETVKKVNGPSVGPFVDWRLSRNGRYAAYAASEHAAGISEVYLVDLQSSSWARTPLLTEQELDQRNIMGVWSPDSSYLVFFGDSDEPGTKDVYLYDTATNATRRSNYSIAEQERVLGFTPSGAFLISAQSRGAGSFQLVGTAPNGREIDLHENTLGKPYLAAQVAADGTGAVFCNGTANEDLYFVDLRDNFNQAVTLPGEGTVAHCYDVFAPDSKGFVYYRTASDGSRKLYWVDSSRQVLGRPVQVTRDGRARDWAWQPWVDKPQ
ncbi:MAG: hypothetical protein ABW061_16535 [Polyangiaceae bacterium]